MARKIEVQIVGDASSFHKALGQATDTSSKFGHVLGSAVRVGAYAAAGGIVALGAALKVGYDEFTNQQKVAAQTRAVLKSTGGAANVTAKHVQDLGTQLLNLSGIDDEVVKSGENILLTFRNIQNTKTNKTFDQATVAATNLSVAMGEDMKSAALQVGKALNDPVHGLTALKRVGVQFTDAQTNLIKKLVDTGKTAEAQKIILGELNKEFGGSAKAAGTTLAGQLDILKEKFKNAAGEVISTLLPYVTRLANFAFPLLVSAIGFVVGSIKNAIKWFGQIASHFQVLGGESTSLSTRVTNAWGMIVGFFKQHVMPIIVQLVQIYRDAVKAIAKVLEQHRPELERIWTRVQAVMKAAATILQTVVLPIFRIVLTKVLPKLIGIAIDAIDKLSFAIGEVVSAVKWIGSNAKGAFNALKNAVQAVAGVISALLSPIQSALDAIISDIKWVLKKVPSLPFGLGGSAGVNVPGGVQRGGHPQPTGGGNVVGVNHIHVYLDGKEIHSSVQRQDRVYRRQNGRSAFA